MFPLETWPFPSSRRPPTEWVDMGEVFGEICLLTEPSHSNGDGASQPPSQFAFSRKRQAGNGAHFMDFGKFPHLEGVDRLSLWSPSPWAVALQISLSPCAQPCSADPGGQQSDLCQALLLHGCKDCISWSWGILDNFVIPLKCLPKSRETSTVLPASKRLMHLWIRPAICCSASFICFGSDVYIE